MIYPTEYHENDIFNRISVEDELVRTVVDVKKGGEKNKHRKKRKSHEN